MKNKKYASPEAKPVEMKKRKETAAPAVKQEKTDSEAVEKRKVAILFPGIGYHCDKPLLYYSGKLARTLGYEVIPVPYGNFPEKVKGDAAKMEASFRMALEQAREILKEVDWNSYDEILFISKSVGTVVSGAFAAEQKLKVRSILFTPVEATFGYPIGEAIVFHGTADPWAETPAIVEKCAFAGLPLFLTEDANHSLETGHVNKDIHHLQKVMKKVKKFMKESSDASI